MNGNITRLWRNTNNAGSELQIDNLTYVYSGNRLTSVTDGANNASGYPGTFITTGNTITYDDNGNMTSMLDKSLSSISYNHLNLPNYIVRGSGRGSILINYRYRADGTKIQKAVNGGIIGQTGMEYLDGFQYVYDALILPGGVSSFLQFVPTSEGYFDYQKNKYIYNYTDHLGNVRLSYTKEDSGIEIIEENNYYPFGLKHEGYNSFTGNPAYQYKYNGKELQSETGMYDYGARFYMPDIGRWGVVDPLAEISQEWSPYRYGYNNPISFIDPTGMLETDYLDVYSGEITHIDDGKDQVIAATTHEIKKAKENFKNNKKEYDKNLTKKENSSSNLNLTSSEFMFLAETLYAESSGGFGETLGIFNVLENRANNEGNTVMDQLSADSPYGVYGVWKTSNGKDSDYKYAYQNEVGPGTDKKKSNIHKAIAVGIMTTKDVTNGAFFWDGKDIKTNSHYKKWGVTFSSPSHNLWGLKNTSDIAQLITTRAIGNTTFTKFQNQGKKWSDSK